MKERRQNSALCVINGHLSSQESGVGAQISNTKDELYSELTLEKMIQALTQYLQSKVLLSQMTAAKVMDVISRLRRMRRTSSRRSIRLYPGQNGRCINVIENSKVRMSRHLDTSTEAQMAKIMVQYGRPSCSS